MATYAQHAVGLANGHTLYLEVSRNSADINGNYSRYAAKLRIIESGGTYMIATVNRNMGIAGNTIASINNSYDTRNDIVFDWQGDVQINHDANGNASFNVFANWSTPYTGTGTTGNGSISQTFTADRLPLAPGISSLLADTITPVAARLRAEINGFGHGTSANLTMYYRLQGSATWISLGLQGDAVGYNDWNVTGLLPNRIYEYYANVTNNNGDSSNSAAQTFTTLSGVKMITVAGGTVDRVVKQILPSGVTTTRIVTKIT